MSRNTKDKPYISHYKPLHDWIMKIEARCMIQEMNEQRSIEMYMTPQGKLFIVVVHSNHNGWEIYTPPVDSNKVDDTLKAAEVALGIKSE